LGTAIRIHPPLEKLLSPQVDVFMSIRIGYVHVKPGSNFELFELIAIIPFEMSAASFAVGNVLAGLVFLD